MTPRLTLTAVAMVAALEAVFFMAVPAGAQDGAQNGATAMPADPQMEMGRGPHGMAMFEMLDTDGDGTVTAEELLVFRKASVLGVDTNTDGKLSAEELAARDLAMMTQMANARAARMVAELDVDGDGLISVEEMAARPMPMFDRLDADGDGAITRAEAEAAQARMNHGPGKGPGRGDRHGPKGHCGWGDGGPEAGDMPPPPPPPPPAEGN